MGFVSSVSRYLKRIVWGLISFIRSNRGLYLVVRGILSVKRNGLAATVRKAADYVKQRLKKFFSSLESEIYLTKNERAAQEHTVFPEQIKIGVITPLFNTREQFAREMIESVLAQTYGNWELCLADGSGEGHENLREICESYAAKDARIKYLKLEKNLGVSGNSNKAIEMSDGDYIGLLDHDDLLHPSALYEVTSAICLEGADFVYTDEAAFSPNRMITLRHHKPDFAIDTLCSHNYISRFTVFSRALMEKSGVFRSGYDGSQDYDLILRYTCAASKICHISRLLYFHRSREKSNIDKKLCVISAAENAIGEHLKNRGISARVEGKIGLPGFYRAMYDLTERPLISIIIPNKDNSPVLRSCISSIREKTTYNNYEIIIVENNSTEDATFTLYKELKRYANIRTVYWKGEGFNYSEICNFGGKRSNGRQLVFLNNDVEIITPNWIEEMLMYSQRRDVGAVGIKLYFRNRSIQHAGVLLGAGGAAAHFYYGAPRGAIGYMGKLQIVQNMSVVTAACMMTRKSVFEEAGGFPPEFQASFNDVDLCIKIRKAGYLIVWTPYAEAYHLESRSRGYNTTSDRRKKLAHETALLKAKWERELAAGDPYYNRNFSYKSADYTLK